MIQNEVLAFLFKNLPGEWQWIMAFLIPSLRGVDKWVRTKMVNKMAGNQDEPARVLLGVAISLFYALFVAVPPNVNDAVEHVSPSLSTITVEDY